MELANGWRYAPAYVAGVLVGGTRERLFAGTNLKPRKLPEKRGDFHQPALSLPKGGARIVRRFSRRSKYLKRALTIAHLRSLWLSVSKCQWPVRLFQDELGGS